MQDHIENFDSIEALVDKYKASHTSYTWGDSAKVSDTIKLALNGDSSLVARAESLLSELSVNVESVIAEWMPSVQGPIVSVPSYLANVPTTFRKIQHIASESAPLKIYVGIASSGGVDNETLISRGVTIMALVMVLQKIRPVEVILYSEHGSNSGFNILYTVKLESNPISLAHCINALSNPYMARHLTFGLAYTHNWTGKWPKAHGGYQSTEYTNWRNEVMGVTENDLVIDSSYYGTEIVTNPIGWINSHLGLEKEEN